MKEFHLFFFFFLMDELNWMMIIIATILSFAIGAVWHGPIFGKLWMRIHHGKDTFSDAEMKKQMVGMWKIMLTEFLATLIMIIGLACIIRVMPPEYSGMHTAFMVWLAFIVTTLTSNTIWGNDAKKWMVTKIAVSAGARLIELLVAGYLLTM